MWVWVNGHSWNRVIEFRGYLYSSAVGRFKLPSYNSWVNQVMVILSTLERFWYILKLLLIEFLSKTTWTSVRCLCTRHIFPCLSYRHGSVNFRLGSPATPHIFNYVHIIVSVFVHKYDSNGLLHQSIFINYFSWLLLIIIHIIIIIKMDIRLWSTIILTSWTDTAHKTRLWKLLLHFF